MAGGATQQSIRRALGALKDTTTVSLAKVNSEFKELDIAIVKGTNHVECPPKEKHMRVIFAATSAMRPQADLIYCLQALARRLSKTHNWTVALKALIVIHRLLWEGDPAFRDELCTYTYERGHMLNLSNFKDDSSSNAWDYSAWVRTYALYLEERLECFRVLRYDVEAERLQANSKIRGLGTEDLLEQLPALQQLLYRLVGCQPEGAARSNYVIQYALALVLKESFKLYCAINDGIINLLDKFFDMQRHAAMKALDIYKRAAQQADKLSGFYEVCKSLELARNFQFPSLAQPPQSFLATMEEYVKDAPRLIPIPRDVVAYNDEIPMERLRITYYEKGEEPESHPLKPSANKTPTMTPVVSPSPPVQDKNLPAVDQGDLLGLHVSHPDASALEESNALALAIVTSGPTSNGNNHDASSETTATGWELTLVTNPSSSNATIANTKVGGGFDQLTLESLYEDAAVRQHTSYSLLPGPYGIPSNPFDTGLHDPFIASSRIPAPPNVQLTTMVQTQQMMMYQNALGQHQMMEDLARSSPFMNPYAMNLPSGAPQDQYQHNPFGNPGLL